MNKRIAAAALAAALCLAGCSQTRTPQEQPVAGGYREQKISMPEGGLYATAICPGADGSVTLYGSASAADLYSGWQGGLLCYTARPDGTMEQQTLPWEQQLAAACADTPRSLSMAADESGQLYLLASPRENDGQQDPFRLWTVEGDQLREIEVDFSGWDMQDPLAICSLSGVSGEYLFVESNSMDWAIFDTQGQLCRQAEQSLLPGQTQSVMQISAVRSGYAWAGNNGYAAAYTLPDFKKASDLELPTGWIFPDWEGEGFYHISLEMDQERIISHYTLTGDTREILMHGSDYAWGLDTTSVSLGCAAADGSLWLLVESAGIQSLYRYVYDPDKTVENTLTVFSLEENGTVRQTIAAWNSLHPETQVEYTVGMAQADQTGVTREDVIRQLNTQLLAGSGPDVVILDGLSADSMIDQGMLADLSELGDWSGVRDNVLSSYRREEGLFAIPTGLCAYIAGGRPETVDQRIESLAGIADAMEAMPAPADSDACCMSFAGNLYEHLFDLFYPASAGAIWQQGQFQPDAFADFTALLQRIASRAGVQTIAGYDRQLSQQSGSATGQELYENYSAGSLNNFWNGQGVWFAAGWDSAYQAGSFSLLQRDETGHLTGTAEGRVVLYPLPGVDGQGVFQPLSAAALPASGSQKELAAEFVQLMVSDQVQASTGLEGLPVTASGLEQILAQVRQNDPFVIEGDLEGLLNGLQPALLDEVLQAAVREAAASLYDGEITLEQAQAQVEQAASLRLAEQD